VLIKLSTVEGMFGPPLEMFHCGGTAIVFDVTGADEYIVSGRNALVVPRDNPQAVIETIHELRDAPAKLSALKGGALETASQWPSWERSSAEFALWVNAVMKEPATNRAELSVVIAAANEQYRDGVTLAHGKGGARSLAKAMLRYLASKSPQGLVETIKGVEYSLESMYGGTRVS
jgi:hypothetical protein